MENTIDKFEESLVPLTKFILPGGCESSSFLHLSRTVCRRLEREANNLFDENVNPNQFGKNIDKNTLVYFNRLSDFLFVAARKANNFNKIADIVAS
jgi:cob(I)alamin adenosyltransferase